MRCGYPEIRKVERTDLTTYVRSKGQITIPADIRREVHLEEGDPIEVEVVEDGILLKPRKIIDAAQAWFWTPEWQASIRRSVEQVAAGEAEVMDEDGFLAALDGD